ncbi:hypothetical protein WG75_00025 [Citromicrobium sp. WPS32]|nr:hypothetical protein WG75_00025 [Citromicrobium sp. WPS32]
MKPRKYTGLTDHLREIYGSFGIELPGSHNDAITIVETDRKQLSKGFVPERQPAFLKWFWLYHEAEARKFISKHASDVPGVTEALAAPLGSPGMPEAASLSLEATGTATDGGEAKVNSSPARSTPLEVSQAQIDAGAAGGRSAAISALSSHTSRLVIVAVLLVIFLGIVVVYLSRGFSPTPQADGGVLTNSGVERVKEDASADREQADGVDAASNVEEPSVAAAQTDPAEKASPTPMPSESTQAARSLASTTGQSWTEGWVYIGDKPHGMNWRDTPRFVFPRDKYPPTLADGTYRLSGTSRPLPVRERPFVEAAQSNEPILGYINRGKGVSFSEVDGIGQCNEEQLKRFEEAQRSVPEEEKRTPACYVWGKVQNKSN